MIESVPVSRLHRAVRLTARASALLFAGSQVAPAGGLRTARAARSLYLGFAAAHAAHFVLVARYAKVVDGRNLFPGGRGLRDVGGWPTIWAIYLLFAALVVSSWPTVAAWGAPERSRLRAARAASALIGGCSPVPISARRPDPRGTSCRRQWSRWR